MTYIIAVGSIPYHKYPTRTFSDITLETLIDLQKDLKEETMILSRDTEESSLGIVQWIVLDNQISVVKWHYRNYRPRNTTNGLADI